MALDGLRTFAIVAIMLYHLSVSWLPSGHMGVVVFLVLTGYLTSSTILRKIRKDGGVSIPGLWGGRIGRIWPPMFVMVAFTTALCVLFNHILLTKMRPDIIPSLLLSNNVFAILRGASYFDKLGGVSPLTHLWYLGVDLQFFLVWTPLVTFLCPDGRSSRLARRLALVAALASAVAMAVLFDPNGDPTRVYYGPDTRAFAPLLGGWLGLAWPLGGRPVRLTGSGFTLGRLPLDILGPLALAGIVAVMALVPDTSVILYRGGMALVALLSCVVVASMIRRRAIMARIFSFPPLVWLGTRSFGFYLWHFPIFQLLKVTNNQTPIGIVIIACALSLAAAELSVRLVERPLARRDFPLVIAPVINGLEGWVRWLGMLPAALLAIALLIGGIGLVITPDETAVPDDALVSTGVGAAEARDLTAERDQKDQGATDAEGDSKGSQGDSKSDSKDSSTDSKNDKESSSKDADETKKVALGNDVEGPQQDLDNLPSGSVTLEASKTSVANGYYTPVIIADSVAGDASWYFDEHMPDALLDSYVGRRPDQALDVLNGYLEQGVIGNIVVLDSFSNVPATDETMEALIDSCGDRHVYLVNVRIPEKEQEQINDTLARFADSYDNVELIDWYSYSEGHPEWLYADGEHLTPEGQPYYVDMISNAIAYDFASEGGLVVGEDE